MSLFVPFPFTWVIRPTGMRALGGASGITVAGSKPRSSRSAAGRSDVTGRAAAWA